MIHTETTGCRRVCSSNLKPLMSALGHKPAFPRRLAHVRFTPKAGIAEW
jgi:hypothetical protein